MARETPDGGLDRMVEFMVRKRDLIEEIRLLTSGQSALLVPEKVAELLAVVERKQGLMDEVNRIDAEVSRLGEDVKKSAGEGFRGRPDESFKERLEKVEELRREIILILQETRRIDEENRRKADEEFRKLKAGVQSMRAGQGLVKAYRSPAALSGGCFVDKKK